MRTATFNSTNRNSFVLQSLVPRRIWLAVLIVGLPCAERVAYGDNFAAFASLEVCCDSGDCLTASCTLDGEVDFTWDISDLDCFPSCTVVATLTNDSTCSAETDPPFKFLRVAGDDVCQEDVDNPFEKEFELDTPFTLLHWQMCEILDPDQNIVVVGPFTANSVSVTLRGDVTAKTGFTCHPVPAVSEWGLVALTLLVLGTGTVVLMRRRAVTT